MLDDTKAYAMCLKKLTPLVVVEFAHVKSDRDVSFDLRNPIGLVICRSKGGHGFEEEERGERDRETEEERKKESGGWIDRFSLEARV